MSDDYPGDLRYTQEHEWARLDGKVATIGITKFAVDSLGDITQVDLPKNTRSGLIDAVRRLENLERIAIIHLGEQDIVRHPLVQAIVKAYEDDKPRKRRTES